MIKKLHYIKEDYSGDIEKYCVGKLRELYPDFEFMAWRPGSSPLRILYDNGGLFIGQNIIALRRIPDSYFEKSFVSFNNSITTDYPNFNFCCYADKEKDPFYLRCMEIGTTAALAEEGYNGSFNARTNLNGCDIELKDINLVNRVKFGGIDNLSKDVFINDDVYLMSMNFDYINNTILHYVIINPDSESNKVHAICDNYFNFKQEKDSRHYLLFVCNDLTRDLTSRIGELLSYKNVNENKKGGIIVVGNNLDNKALNKLLLEYIGRWTADLKSCERLL